MYARSPFRTVPVNTTMATICTAITFTMVIDGKIIA